jgi:hypothetical protein
MSLKVYAVLKNGRRYEDINYLEKSAAEEKLSKILAAREQYSNACSSKPEKLKFSIVELDKPNKAW